MLFEKFYQVTYSWPASVIIDAKNSGEADAIFSECYDGQDLEPTQVPSEAAIFIEPTKAKPTPYKKELIEPGSEDDVYILRACDDAV